ncbi:S8 family peptidase, partial [Halorhodospira halophila]|uniref:S8 family peptidase n=1 Tax=Halorhodospira halophila TaxID=1053 RepID=UPI0019144316
GTTIFAFCLLICTTAAAPSAAQVGDNTNATEAENADDQATEERTHQRGRAVALGAVAAGATAFLVNRSDSESADPGNDVEHYAPRAGEAAPVAIIDSDFRTTHQELETHQDRYKRLYNPEDRDWDVTEEDAQAHGTRVASILAGTQQGVAPNADLHIYADGLGTGAWSRETFKAGVSAAEADDARVLNLSAGYFDRTDAIPERLREFTADDRLLVIAAGNEGGDGPIGDVAGAIDTFEDRAIAVGALDEDNQLWEKSNRAGPDSSIQARFLTAPGVGIESADSSGDDHYSRADGTSFSSPKVAGAAALIYAEWEHLSAQEIAEILLETADRDFEGYDPTRYGQGRLDIEAALEPQGTLEIPLGGGDTAPAADTRLTGSNTVVQALLETETLADSILTDRFNRDFSADLSATVDYAAAVHTLDRRMGHALVLPTSIRTQAEAQLTRDLTLRVEATPPSAAAGVPDSLRVSVSAPAGRIAMEKQHLPTAAALIPESLAFEPRTWLRTDAELAAYNYLQRFMAHGSPTSWLDIQAEALLAGDETNNSLRPSRRAGDQPPGADEQTTAYHAGIRLHRHQYGLELAHTVYHHKGHGAELRGDGGFAIDGATHQRSTLGLRWNATTATDLMLEHRHTHREADNLNTMLRDAELQEQITLLGLEHRRDAHLLGLAVGHWHHRGGDFQLRLPTAIEADGSLRQETRSVDVPSDDAVIAEAFWRFPMAGGDGHLNAFRDQHERGAALVWSGLF